MDQDLHIEKLSEAFDRACEQMEQENYEAALEALVWLHDNPVPDALPTEMFRRIYGFQAWGLLASKYPPAKKKMEEVLAKKIEAAKNETPSKSVKADIGRLSGILSELSISPE
ncbi:hypothetical protein LXA47_07640 [Massilia sp. P8910]|uniref:hypothetical protein n=1 Tax=Massilia antarctica TaxID=2765360 RepID=UPI001E34C359|nr:hypothetical protein [Massilia antarctica]MCE3603477.1 hypothetical protein [Massilia antarctica]